MNTRETHPWCRKLPEVEKELQKFDAPFVFMKCYLRWFYFRVDELCKRESWWTGLIVHLLTQDSLKSCHFAWFKDTVCRRINDQFVANWRSKIEDSISCSNYKLYKGQFECQKYLKELPPSLAIAMIKFRCKECKTPRGSRTIRPCSS